MRPSVLPVGSGAVSPCSWGLCLNPVGAVRAARGAAGCSATHTWALTPIFCFFFFSFHNSMGKKTGRKASHPHLFSCKMGMMFKQ